MNEVILSTFFGNEITGEKRIIFFFLDIISRKYDLFLIIRFGTFTLSPTFSLASIRQPFVSAYFYISSRWTISHRLFPWFRLRFVALDIKTRKKKNEMKWKRSLVVGIQQTTRRERSIEPSDTVPSSCLLLRYECLYCSSVYEQALAIFTLYWQLSFSQHCFHIFQTTLFSYLSDNIIFIFFFMDKCFFNNLLLLLLLVWILLLLMLLLYLLLLMILKINILEKIHMF